MSVTLGPREQVLLTRHILLYIRPDSNIDLVAIIQNILAYPWYSNMQALYRVIYLIFLFLASTEKGTGCLRP